MPKLAIPALSTNTIYMFLMIFFLISAFLFVTFLNSRKLITNTRQRIIAIFHQPGGGEVPELCEVHGVFVFRGQARKSSFFQTKHDVGTAREVYILQVPNATHDELKAAMDKAQGVLEEAAKDSGEIMEEYKKTTVVQVKKRKELKEALGLIKDEVEKELETGWETMISKSMSSRGHMTYPVIMPPNKPGMFQAQVSLPVAHFIEGYTLEVDPVSLALGQFEADPLYNSAMVGSIVDQRLLELAAWFSSYIDKLEQQLLKMVNPTILYVMIGLVGLFALIGAYFGFSDHALTAKMAKQINEYIALFPTNGS